MTINTVNITSGPYTGNNTTDQYSYGFKVVDKTQLQVYETTAAGVRSLLVVDTDYTVANIGNAAGGIITRVAGNLPTGAIWYIRANYAETQLTAFRSQGGFKPQVHEDAMDKMTILIQQKNDFKDRALRLSDEIDIDGDFTIDKNAANRAGKHLSFDTAGDLQVSAAPQLLTADGIYDSVALMKADSLAAGLYIQTRGYYAAGDGGAATYLIVAPQAFDGYGDHELANGNIAVLQNGNTIIPAQYGVKQDGTDASDVFDAIQVVIESVYTDLLMGAADSYTNYSGLTVDLTGETAISRTLVLYNGVDYVLPNGSYIKALTTGMTMVRNANNAERTAASGTSRYSCNDLSFVGGGIIDGDDKARHGVICDTVAAHSKIEVTIIQCTDQSTPTTGTGSIGTNTLTLASTTGIDDNSILYIATETIFQFYQVISLSGSVATLSNNLQANVSSAAVYARGVGFLGRMMQQSDVDISCSENDLGEVWGENTDGIQCTDIRGLGINQKNNHGFVNFGMSGSNFDEKRIQHSFGEEIISTQGVGVMFDGLYIETLGATEADNQTPPTGGSPITSAVLATKPLIDIRGDGTKAMGFTNLRFPQGADLFRRLVRNEGTSNFIDGVSLNTGALLVNPSRAGDYALVEQNSASGSFKLAGVSGFDDVSGAGKPWVVGAANGLIVDESGNLPSDVRYGWSIESFGDSMTGGMVHTVRADPTTKKAFRVYDNDDAEPTIEIRSDGVHMGAGGASATDVKIRRKDAESFEIWNGAEWERVVGANNATDAELNDITNVINTGLKYQGRRVFNTTIEKPVYAADATAAGLWKDAQATLTNTPV